MLSQNDNKKEKEMTVADFIKELSRFPQDKPIEIECPNGVMVEPSIKFKWDKPFDKDKKLKSLVVSWRS